MAKLLWKPWHEVAKLREDLKPAKILPRAQTI